MASKKTPAPRKAAAKSRPTPVRAAAKPEPKAMAKAKPTPLAPEPKQPAKVKIKLVRDSFTIPKNEYALLDTLKKRALNLACPAKKSEILRAGIKVLNSLPDAAFFAAIDAVPNLKTGRPKQEK